MLLPILANNQLVDAVVLHLYPPIRSWNKERNELKFSMDLEGAMLQEEYKEFLDATTLVDMFDAICDFGFVLCGTYAKWMEHADDSQEVMVFIDKYSQHFVDMFVIFGKYVSQEYHMNAQEKLHELVLQGIEVVVKKNFEKGNELDENGKVKKPAGFVGPEADLQILLDTFGNK